MQSAWKIFEGCTYVLNKERCTEEDINKTVSAVVARIGKRGTRSSDLLRSSWKSSRGGGRDRLI